MEPLLGAGCAFGRCPPRRAGQSAAGCAQQAERLGQLSVDQRVADDQPASRDRRLPPTLRGQR
eukprot:14266990-Alexandrium_andersonii.AAC.1